MIYITGDTHGEISRFSENEVIKNLNSDDYLIICGDFGFIFSQNNTITAQIENENLDYISSLPFTTLFIDGTVIQFPPNGGVDNRLFVTDITMDNSHMRKP